ncbi:ankyrin repeat and SOCS box protein 2-like isoform X3 [Phyllopteryx taeniolatus]|uniref:ankyrin repeat and SOCS box protein 2-like isoform X3 n=1 Tax=Phyllopteryx taeniolatus TaxID=161469 RepID=UPI002AD56994|nr:ankyrin repeat and SOCS box protein 2-like isoform X3 [Phyllopteryx taeniolatus]XP_061651574.1 ankyrin repeat and SOCS box protein 2-like isoform X3 [Phyllopteryx taeniolatus]
MSAWSSGMIAINGCGSLHQRLNVDVKNRLAVDLFSASGNTVHQLRDVDPVVLAIRGGDAEAVKKQAASSPHSLMRENKEGWIPLHHAAFSGQHECLRTLLNAHPGSADKRTLQEQTGLLLAASGDHLPCVKCLLESGADPDISNKNKESPLYTACRLDNVDMVCLILSFGASVNQRCPQGWTALHQAVSRNNTATCDILIGAGATINPSNTYSITPLIVAARLGRLKALNYLIGKGADVNMQTCEGITALHEASKNGHKEIAAVLLSTNADANKTTDSGLLPLHVAAQHGHQEVVRLLVPVTSRTRLRHSGISPLHLAAEHNRPQVAAVLLKTGADVNATLAPARSARYADGRTTALGFAVANGSTETAAVLLNAGAATGLDPVSPLLLAVQRGSVATVSLLLQRGADVNARMPSWATTFPPVVALCMDNLPLLKCLLDNGCDALSCFSCPYGGGPHPEQSHIRNIGDLSSLNSSGPAHEVTQFCEWISSSFMRKWAGPIVDLLLEHVAHVQLCSKLTQLLESRHEWVAVKRKSYMVSLRRHGDRLVRASASQTEDRGSIPGPACVEFACSPRACVGFLRALQFPPASQKHACVTSSTTSSLQTECSQPRGPAQTEIPLKFTSTRTTDRIPHCDGLMTLR